MIRYEIGNLLESDAEALVNTVNTDGIMGKGIALQFKNEFPKNYKLYVKACADKQIAIGKLLVTDDASLLLGKRTIINFPTKTSWRKPSEYSYIEAGMIDLVRIIQVKRINSIAIPPLGAGNGGLEWNKVKMILEKHLTAVPCDIRIYQPNAAMQEVLKKERVKLTPARAMLLSVLFELVRNGEFVSEFTAEKVAYFLQRFGAGDVFKLDFQPNFYGPYSGKVKHVLYYLNGSYVMGYSSKDKKPFEELGLVQDGEADVIDFLNRPENVQYKSIVNKTKEFLSGFYSNFGLELLSTIDFTILAKKGNTLGEISAHLEQWSDRKKTLFSNPKFIQLAVGNIQQHLPHN